MPSSVATAHDLCRVELDEGRATRFDRMEAMPDLGFRSKESYSVGRFVWYAIEVRVAV